MLYERMTGDTRYQEFATLQRDWLLGRNPWVWISNSYGNAGFGRFTISRASSKGAGQSLSQPSKNSLGCWRRSKRTRS